MFFLGWRGAAHWEWFYGLSPRSRSIFMVGVVVLIGVVIGSMTMRKTQLANESKAEAIAHCTQSQSDKACQDAIEAHHDDCFKSNYKSGSKGSQDGVRTSEYIICIEIGHARWRADFAHRERAHRAEAREIERQQNELIR